MKRKSLATVISFVLLLLVLSFFFLFNLDGKPLYIWDEARNANNALQMLANGNWIVTHYEGAPEMWNTKPPLLIWLQVICMKVLGINEWSVRLPSALAAIGTGLLLWQFARKQLNNILVGLLAGMILATTYAYLYNHGGRSGDYDTLMIFFSLAASYSVFIYCEENRDRMLLNFWIFLTLSVLTKGVAGGLLTPGLFIYLLFRKKLPSLLRSRYNWLGLTVFILFVGGYYILREQYNPGYLQAVRQNELGGRYLVALEQHARPFGFYWDAMNTWLYTYWRWFVVPAFVMVILKGAEKWKHLSLFHLVLIIPFFLLISFGRTKLEWYVMPVYPFLALQIAMFLNMVLEMVGNRSSASWQVPAVLLLAIAIFWKPAVFAGNEVLYKSQGFYEEEPHRQSNYIRAATKEGRSLDGYRFIYEGYYGQIMFYTDKLKYEGRDVHLHQQVPLLEAGMKVVVSQPGIEEQLRKEYKVQLLDENWGSKAYLVQARL